MKRLILFLAVAVSCMGQGLTLRSPLRDIAVAPAASALLIDENFEGAGTPSPWTVGAGSPNFDNTASPLSGSQDLMMTDGTFDYAKATFTGSTEVWCQFEFKLSSAPLGVTQLFFLLDVGLTKYVNLVIDGNSQLIISDSTSGTLGITTDALSAATKYWVFYHAAKGTGANGVADIEFSTTSTRTGSGNKFASCSNHNLDANMAALYVYLDGAGWTGGSTFQVDNMKVSNTGWPP